MATKLKLEMNLDNLSAEDRKALFEIINKANQPETKLWKPAEGEAYYGINLYDISDCHNVKQEVTDEMYAIGNCFRTKEEAEFVVERLKVIRELREFAESEQPKECVGRWYLNYNFRTRKIHVGSLYLSAQSDMYFATAEIARKAIATVGEDRIKRYYFNIK